MASSNARMSSRKIFCIGFNKSGTSSLNALFRAWGMASMHGMYSEWDADDPRFEQYECFTDGEQHDFSMLDVKFPGSKFILLSRRLDDWLISRIRHTEIRKARKKTGWMRKEYEEDASGAVRKWVERRGAYYDAVYNYFAGRTEDLLLLNICDSSSPRTDVARVASFVCLDTQRSHASEYPHLRDSDVASNVVRGRLGWLAFWRSHPRTKEEIRDEVEAELSKMGLPEAAWIDDGLNRFGTNGMDQC